MTRPGWPVLLPVAGLERLRALGADRMPGELIDDLGASGWPVRAVDLGDPGTVRDGSVPRSELPPYRGPSEPASGHVHEWGEETEADDLEV